ncbi:cysteine-rich repeat secretory protein 38-like [Silene latifolia]|uniref:cysteine-rich repeat secretory protein 38-like n=1 Tax=Silene latifolia TaxID=37657 RepID=UPI003D77125D
MVTFSQKKITLVAFFVLLVHHYTDAQYLHQDCYEGYGTYSLSSDYGSNIDTAITELASLASTTHFNTITVGNGTEQVNAFFSCRYDMSSDTCQSCVTSTLDRVSECFRSVASIQFYQECTVYYSNYTIFSIMEELPSYTIHGLDPINDTEFDTLLSKTFETLISDVISEFADSSRYFATGTADYSTETIYALAQCNQDLTSSDCKTCLEQRFGNFTADYPGAFLGQVFTPSCTLSYKLSSVTMTSPYDFTVTLVPDVGSPPPESSPDVPSPPESSPDTPTTPDSPDEDLAPPFSFNDEDNASPPPPSSLPGLKSNPSGSTDSDGMISMTAREMLKEFI